MRYIQRFDTYHRLTHIGLMFSFLGLAFTGVPLLAGFFSKDALIEAVGLSTLPAARYGYWCVVIGVFVTAFYTFRLVFMTFHGTERMDEHTREHLHESPWVVTLPLVLLAIPSVIIGWPVVGAVLFGDYFGNAVYVAPAHDVLARLGEHYHGPWAFVRHGLSSPILGLAGAGESYGAGAGERDGSPRVRAKQGECRCSVRPDSPLLPFRLEFSPSGV